jgi:hypothetical protein
MHRLLTKRIEIPWRRVFKRVGIGFITGILVGILMIVLAILFERDEEVSRAWRFIHKPALQLADWWTRSGMPPQQEAAWIVPPAVAVIGEWVLVGVVIGFCFCIQKPRKVDHVA